MKVMGRGFKKLVMVVAGGICFSICLSSPAAFASSDCGKLQKQLLEMQKAQGIILESMAKKNTSLASTLDQFANDLNIHDKTPSQVDVLNLRRSAEAFRGHSDRELLLIAKFQARSKELINETVKCLSQAEPSESQRLSANPTNQFH